MLEDMNREIGIASGLSFKSSMTFKLVVVYHTHGNVTEREEDKGEERTR
jgi:hypothetical protein